jgi:hypothetical protein
MSEHVGDTRHDVNAAGSTTTTSHTVSPFNTFSVRVPRIETWPLAQSTLASASQRDGAHSGFPGLACAVPARVQQRAVPEEYMQQRMRNRTTAFTRERAHAFKRRRCARAS